MLFCTDKLNVWINNMRLISPLLIFFAMQRRAFLMRNEQMVSIELF